MREARLTFQSFMQAIAAVVLLALATMPPATAQQANTPPRAADYKKAVELFRAGRFAEAEPIAQRYARDVERFHKNDRRHPDWQDARQLLGTIYLNIGPTRYKQAEAEFERLLASFEQPLDLKDEIVNVTVSNIAAILVQTDRSEQALPLYDALLTLDPKDDPVAYSGFLKDKAQALINIGRELEAEAPARRALEILTAHAKPELPLLEDKARALQRLADIYFMQGRHREAALRTVEEMRLHEASRNDVRAAQTRVRLAARLNRGQMFDEALKHADQAIAQRSLLLPDRPEVVVDAYNQRAQALIGLGRPREAEAALRQAIELGRSRNVPEQFIGTSYNNLGFVFRAAKENAKAHENLMLALEIRKKDRNVSNTSIADSLGNIAVNLIDSGNLTGAAPFIAESTERIIARARELRGARADKSALEYLDWLSGHFGTRVAVISRLTRDDARSLDTAYVMAQWAERTQAGRAVALAAQRFASGSPQTADMRRRWLALKDEQVELADKLDKLTTGTSSATTRAQVVKLTSRSTQVDAEISRIETQLKSVGESTGWVDQAPLGVSETQALLGDDEALMLFLHTRAQSAQLPAELYSWIVTKNAQRWHRIDPSTWQRVKGGKDSLGDVLAGLRCGLDAAAWRDDDGARRCAELLGVPVGAGRVEKQHPPFDLERAHALYRALLGPSEGLLQGKRHLIIVPGEALVELPFQVLVTTPPAKRFAQTAEELAAVGWLATRQPISLLPSVATLKALRSGVRPSAAKTAYLGIGSPSFDAAAQSQAEWQDCQAVQKSGACQAAFPHTVSSSNRQRSVGSVPKVVDLVRMSRPLPQTACEVCTIASLFGAAPTSPHVKIGTAASEREIRALNETSQLRDYRVIHFATHGVLASTRNPYPESGLTLSPPAAGSETEQNDGFLATSEIARLDLDADWVILSACNTAGGTRDDPEAFSGLVRAFFYAGARALLVSNWDIYTNAGVELTTRTLQLMNADARLGRAAAMRTALAAMLEGAKASDEAAFRLHPAYWGAFSIVGEGGR